MNFQDNWLLSYAKDLYTNGEYLKSKKMIIPLMEKYENFVINNQYLCDLHISYDNICNVLNINNVYFSSLHYINKNIKKLNLSIKFQDFFNSMYCTSLLRQKKYKEAQSLICYNNNIQGPNINFKKMAFFKQNDVNKTLLIYCGGGIGDYIMFGRIIFEVCEKYTQNHIILLITFPKLVWLFARVFEKYNNIHITVKLTIDKNYFDYHCSFFQLFQYMQYTCYEDIPYIPYLEDLNLQHKNHVIFSKLKNDKNKKILINWKGNIQNLHEKYNRSISLTRLEVLFKKYSGVTWIVSSQSIDKHEYEILRKYDAVILKDEIENFDSPDSFYDTMLILKNIDVVISTDTSIVHISLTMNISTIVLLTAGCEWRWTTSNKTNWYPNAVIFRQNCVQNWDNVISDIDNYITSLNCRTINI